MADEKEDSPSAASSMPRVRRRAPTIELKATEVAVEPPVSAPVEPPPSSESAAPPEYPTQPPNYDVGGTAPPDEPPPSHDVSGGGFNSFIRRPVVEAGLAGGLVALAVFGVLWLAGMFTSAGNIPAQRVADLEARLRELASRPAPASPDPRAIEDVNARLGRLESAVARVGNNPAGASEETVKSLQAAVADVTRRVDDNATAVRETRSQTDAALKAATDAARAATERNDLEALSNRVAALERASKALVDDVAKSVAATGDRPLRAVVAAQALHAAVERGDPFTAELTAARALNSSQALAPLEPFAASGLPSPAALARQLSELAPAMLKMATPPAPAGGFLDRLQANAEKLVRIRPIDEAPGGDPGAVISRAEAKAMRADLAGAVAELKALPTDVRAPADEWIKKAEARNDAVNASRRVVADALAALGKVSP